MIHIKVMIKTFEHVAISFSIYSIFLSKLSTENGIFFRNQMFSKDVNSP